MHSHASELRLARAPDIVPVLHVALSCHAPPQTYLRAKRSAGPHELRWQLEPTHTGPVSRRETSICMELPRPTDLGPEWKRRTNSLLLAHLQSPAPSAWLPRPCTRLIMDHDPYANISGSKTGSLSGAGTATHVCVRRRIKKMKSTKSLMSSPALSIDRLEIFYNKYDSVMVSPKEKDDFIRRLLLENPAIEIL